MTIAAERTTSLYRSAAIAKRRRSFGYDVVGYVAAAADFLIVLASSVVGVLSYHYAVFGILADPAMNVGIGLLTAAIFVLAMNCLHAYRYGELMLVRHQSLLIGLLIPSVLAFLLTVIFFLKLGETFSRGAVLTLAVLSMISLIGARLLWRRRLSSAIAGGWVRPKKALLVCPEGLAADRLHHFASTGGMRIAQVAWFNEQPDSLAQLRERLDGTADPSAIDEIVVIWPDLPVQQLERTLIELRPWPLPVKVVFESFAGAIVSCQSDNIGGVTLFQVQGPPLALAERIAKRTYDIVFALAALILLSPMFLIIAAAIKLDSSGPVFFLQWRLGHANRPFRIVKFRSMTVLENGDAVRQATKDDPRITRVGAFIRAYSIDELPQFLNVLRGDMSVVGPRPHAVAHDDIYDRLIKEYAWRRHVKPGVTGWAQIHGLRGETQTMESMEQRVAHDLWYIDNWSLWLDIKIAARTMLALRGS